MNTATFYADACSYRVYSVVITLYSNFSAFSRHTGNLLDCNKTVCYFGNFSFKQPLKENRACAAKYDFWIVVLVVNTEYHGSYSVSLMIKITWNLLCLRQYQLIAFIVH